MGRENRARKPGLAGWEDTLADHPWEKLADCPWVEATLAGD